MDAQAAAERPGAALYPIMGVAFIAFLVTGAAMPVLPLRATAAFPSFGSLLWLKPNRTVVQEMN